MTDDTKRSHGTDTWRIDVRPRCSKCDRLAVVYGKDGRPFCGRHATIFMVEWGGDPARKSRR